jgi:hypothetical protein
MPTNGRQMVDECWCPVDDTLTTLEEFKERTDKSADVGDLLSLVEAGETNVYNRIPYWFHHIALRLSLRKYAWNMSGNTCKDYVTM